MGEFNQEHVMPKAFGTFEPTNPTLNNCVCAACNEMFGEEIERILARDSFEGWQRFFHGLKRGNIIRHSGAGRIVRRVESHGRLHGAYLMDRLNSETQEWEVDFADQVGFETRSGGAFTFVQLSDIPSRRALIKRGIYTDGKKMALPNDEKSRLRIVGQLQRRGFGAVRVWKEKTPVDELKDSVDVKTLITTDRFFYRAIAKIAFNYSAYILGAASMLASGFNEARQYVRYGVLPRDHQLVFPIKFPSIDSDRGESLHADGNHRLTLGWTKRSTVLVGQVTLFDQTVYGVILNMAFSCESSVEESHRFYLRERKVTREKDLPAHLYHPMTSKVDVRPSAIHEEGVFSVIDIRDGEVIQRVVEDNYLQRRDYEALEVNEKCSALYRGKGRYSALRSSLRKLNHSCIPNVFVRADWLIARRLIRFGEELTIDYSLNRLEDWKFPCFCGEKGCRGKVDGNFRNLPDEVKRREARYLEEWFKQELQKS